MSMTVSEEFKQYADFSVKADRFFNVVNIYGTHHDGLKTIYKSMPKRSKIDEILSRDDIDDDIKDFLLLSATTLNYMATTGIFSDDEHAIDNKDIWEDSLNFSFYTCFNFQWSLFERFLKKMLRKAINANVFPPSVVEKLENKWDRTKQLLNYINSSREVFSDTPFQTVLPVAGWVPNFEDIKYSDLDEIRELRNEFIHHGLEAPLIKTEKLDANQKRYQRSMWILRKFAENIEFEVRQLLEEKK